MGNLDIKQGTLESNMPRLELSESQRLVTEQVARYCGQQRVAQAMETLPLQSEDEQLRLLGSGLIMLLALKQHAIGAQQCEEIQRLVAQAFGQPFDEEIVETRHEYTRRQFAQV